MSIYSKMRERQQILLSLPVSSTPLTMGRFPGSGSPRGLVNGYRDKRLSLEGPPDSRDSWGSGEWRLGAADGRRRAQGILRIETEETGVVIRMIRLYCRLKTFL